MATHASDIITALNSQSIIDKQVDMARAGGLLLLASVEYALKGTEVATDIIELFDLPAGATLIPQMSEVRLPNPGTTLVMSVGDSESVNKYAVTMTASAGGVIAFHTGATNIPAGITAPKPVEKRERVFARLTTVSTLNAGVKLRFTIAYVIRG